MNILALSGWGQPHDALRAVVSQAQFFDYAHYDSVEAALAGIAAAAQGKDAIIGWSLGGQLAVRAVAAGLVRPKKLILIGAPFQFVKNEILPLGMPQDQFHKFRSNYEKNPARTLAKAWELVALGDSNIEAVKQHLGGQSQAAMLEKDWLGWLDRLHVFSGQGLDFSRFPDTLIIHGGQDAVVAVTQAQEFYKNIAGAKHIILPEAGHAPHWHNPQLVRQYITEHLQAAG